MNTHIVPTQTQSQVLLQLNEEEAQLLTLMCLTSPVGENTAAEATLLEKLRALMAPIRSSGNPQLAMA